MSTLDEEGSAGALLSAHLKRLRFEIQGRRVKGDRTPTAIEVPRSFPSACLRLRYWNLPVIFGDVRQPELSFRRRFSEPAYSAPIGPVAPRAAPDTSLALRIVDVAINSARDTYHLDPACPSLEPDTEMTGRVWVAKCNDAHRSRLMACTSCSADLAETMLRVLGVVDESLRRRMPAMRPADSRAGKEIRTARDEDDVPVRETGSMPFGAPNRPNDPRFVVRSAADWGTSAHSMNSDEFLSETTEDDHDWRDEATRYLD